MESRGEFEGSAGASWESRMRQVARCEMAYPQALALALKCVEAAERLPPASPQPLSPGDPGAELQIDTKLASSLECDVRLAVYSLYHADQLMEHEKAVERVIACGKRVDARS